MAFSECTEDIMYPENICRRPYRETYLLWRFCTGGSRGGRCLLGGEVSFAHGEEHCFWGKVLSLHQIMQNNSCGQFYIQLPFLSITGAIPDKEVVPRHQEFDKCGRIVLITSVQ